MQKPQKPLEDISTHALRVESDRAHRWLEQPIRISTHALRMESDVRPPTVGRRAYISIHALRMESDENTTAAVAAEYDFNPRPPHGERLSCISKNLNGLMISIHALRVESDCSAA